jgi:chorismate mutase/prephenate dehydratase
LSRKESVDALRKKIDQVDQKIVGLLSRRASLARTIGRAKNLNHEEIYVPGREKQVLERVAGLNRGPISKEALQAIYREILSASRSVESSLTIVYLGPEATFTQMAAQERFGSSAKYVPAATIGDVFQEVSQRRADYGVVPIENSTEGIVADTLDRLVESEPTICAEVSLSIHLSLLSGTGKREEIRCIVSHPQALAQCRRWLARQLPGLETREVGSTAQAAKMAAQDSTLAAIASDLAKTLYGLKEVAGRIEDQAHNRTRFLVIGRRPAKPSGDDKTSVVFSVKDEVGILHRMLQPFARHKINLTKIESRPLKDKPWEYLFYLDFGGHVEEPKVRKVIQMLEKNCTFMKILGSYPRGL